MLGGMNAQKLRERTAILTQQLEKMISDVNATVGALAETKYWLAEAEKEEQGQQSTEKTPIMAIVPE